MIDYIFWYRGFLIKIEPLLFPGKIKFRVTVNGSFVLDAHTRGAAKRLAVNFIDSFTPVVDKGSMV